MYECVCVCECMRVCVTVCVEGRGGGRRFVHYLLAQLIAVD